MPVTPEEITMLARLIQELNLPTPTQVTDVYKARRSRYKSVRIWSYTDLGTARIRDLFMTDANFNIININKIEIQIENDFNKIINTKLEFSKKEENKEEEEVLDVCEEIEEIEETEIIEEKGEVETMEEKKEIDLDSLC